MGTNKQAKFILEQKLIDLVRDRPIVYKKEHPDYKDINKKNNSWKKLSEILNSHEGFSTDEQEGRHLLTIKDCIELWTQLRNQYATFKRKQYKPSGTGADSIEAPCFFRHSSSMAFLSDKFKPINSETQIFSNVNLEEEFENIVDGLEAGADQDPDKTTRSSSSSSDKISENEVSLHEVPKARSHTKGRGAEAEEWQFFLPEKRQMDKFEEGLLNVLKDSATKSAGDEFDLFCSSLAPKIRRAAANDMKKALVLQFEIHKLLLDAELEML